LWRSVTLCDYAKFVKKNIKINNNNNNKDNKTGKNINKQEKKKSGT